MSANVTVSGGNVAEIMEVLNIRRVGGPIVVQWRERTDVKSFGTIPIPGAIIEVRGRLPREFSNAASALNYLRRILTQHDRDVRDEQKMITERRKRLSAQGSRRRKK